MPELNYVIFRKEDRLGFITFNRPEAMNALNPAVMEQLDRAVQAALAEAEIRAVVVEGQGKAFVAGADIGFFIQKIKAERIQDIYTFTAFGHEVLKKIEASPKPFLAKLDGLSLGGGSELALACQTVVASERGAMGFPETGIGIYPGLGGTQRTTRRVGQALAKYLVLTGQIVGGQDLVNLGLAEYFTPSAEMETRIRELALDPNLVTRGKLPRPPAFGRFAEAENIFADPQAVKKLLAGEVPGEAAQKMAQALQAKAPLALRLAEGLIEEGENLPLERALRLELDHLHEIFSTEDALTGLSSVGRGKPEFQGR